MKNILFILLVFGFCFNATAQDHPKVGDVFKINEPYGQKFNHIKFPKPNILMKRGVIGHYKGVYDQQVIVSEVKTKEDGTTHVILKTKDGSKFFGYLSKVKANFKKALDSGELSVSK